MRAPPRIETERLLLTIPPPGAAPRLVAYALDNERHLARWEPPHPHGFFTDEFWRRRLEKNAEEFASDQSLRLCMMRRDDPEGPVLGQANLSNIVRGAFQACTLGYSI